MHSTPITVMVFHLLIMEGQPKTKPWTYILEEGIGEGLYAHLPPSVTLLQRTHTIYLILYTNYYRTTHL